MVVRTAGIINRVVVVDPTAKQPMLRVASTDPRKIHTSKMGVPDIKLAGQLQQLRLLTQWDRRPKTSPMAEAITIGKLL